MGCSSSTAINTYEPRKQCYNYTRLLDLCSGPAGSFGCFIKKDTLSIFRDIIDENYDLILQYPITLTTIKRPTEYDESRIKIGKTIKHTELLLTDKSKNEFLDALFKNSSISGLKVFFKQFTSRNHSKDNTFNRECIRLREQMNNFRLERRVNEPQYNVSNIVFTPDIHSSYKQKLSDSGLTDKILTEKYISFSIRLKRTYSIEERQLTRIDFIFLELCNEGNLEEYKLTNMLDLNKFIKTMITDLHFLHTQNIYHLDIKPKNIMKCGNRYKLIDYGLSVGLPIVSKVNESVATYLYDNFQRYRGSTGYLNPIYQMIYLKYIEEGTLSKFDISKITYNQARFISHYKEYIITEYINGKQVQLFDIPAFIAKKPGSDLSKYYNFVKHFYSRADWYSLALTINKIVILNKITVTDKYNKGILKLCDISDEELDSNDLYTTLIHAFGLRLSK